MNVAAVVISVRGRNMVQDDTFPDSAPVLLFFQP